MTDNKLTWTNQTRKLRVNHLPAADPLRVLDCYSGYGLVWRHVQRLTGRDIKAIGIETRDIGFNLPGSNMAYLGTLRLDQFDVIDLDAYGVPFDQLRTVIERGYQGVIFVTFIQTLFGGLPNSMLAELGYTPEMVKKIPTSFYKNGWDKMKKFLALRGFKTVTHRSHGSKHYFVINGAEAPARDYDSLRAGRAGGPF